MRASLVVIFLVRLKQMTKVAFAKDNWSRQSRRIEPMSLSAHPLERPFFDFSDKCRIYGTAVTRRLRAMGIRDKPIAPGSPWQNGYAERLIGTSRRECLDPRDRVRRGSP